MRPEPFRLKLDLVGFNFRFQNSAFAFLIKWWLSVLGQLRLIRSISISLLQHLGRCHGFPILRKNVLLKKWRRVAKTIAPKGRDEKV